MNIGSADRAQLDPREDGTGLDIVWDWHVFNNDRSGEFSDYCGLAEFQEVPS